MSLLPCGFCHILGSSTLTHALDDRFTALLAERAGLEGGFEFGCASVFAFEAGSDSRSLYSFSRGDMIGGCLEPRMSKPEEKE